MGFRKKLWVKCGFINDFVHSVASFFSLLHADNLKECESEEDKKLCVCVVKQNYDNGNLEFEPLMLKMR